MADLKPVYRAVSKTRGRNGAGLEEKWGQQYPVGISRGTVGESVAYFRYRRISRKVILRHECNRIGAPSVRKLTKTKGAFRMKTVC